MRLPYVLKCLHVVVYYSWCAIAYGIVFSLLLKEYGWESIWLKTIVILGVFALTLSVAYHSEMRMHMPTGKYIILVMIALSGIMASVKFPLFSPLFFGFFLISIFYKCRDCVTFTRIKP